MRLRRWVVYEFDALPPPRDLVRSKGFFFTKRRAEIERTMCGPTAAEFVQGNQDLAPTVYAVHYYAVMKLPHRYGAIRRWWRHRHYRLEQQRLGIGKEFHDA